MKKELLIKLFIVFISMIMFLLVSNMLMIKSYSSSYDYSSDDVDYYDYTNSSGYDYDYSYDDYYDDEYNDNSDYYYDDDYYDSYNSSYDDYSSDFDMPVWGAIGMELFVSLHMTAFVIVPLSYILSKKNPKGLAVFLSIIRAAILLYFDFFVSTVIAMVDFFAVFIGAFIVVPIAFVLERVFNRKYYALEKQIDKENREIKAAEANHKKQTEEIISDIVSHKNLYVAPSPKNTNSDDNIDPDDPIRFM